MTFIPCGKIYSIRCRTVTLFLVPFAVVSYMLFCCMDVSFSRIFETQSRPSTYGIMFDAGSTGSRIHVFTFQRTKGGQLELKKEYFHQVKPGLSAYANDPEQGALSIEGLLQKAKEIIPKEQWELTPISLKATAGLRMLPSNSSKELLFEVDKLFRDSPFFLPEASTVNIMDGTDEGLYAWITVNFLLGGFRSDISSKLYGTLDLGGGSIQITLNPVDPITLKDSPESFSRHLNIADHQFTVYTHSYLGLGLMAARTSILQLGNDVKDSNSNDVKMSPCIHSSFKDHWKFGGKSLNIGGLGSYGFSDCEKEVKRVISDSKVHKPAGIQSIEMYAFSYFCDRAVDMGLIDLIMETRDVVLTFESVDEILWCDHSIETSSAVLLHDKKKGGTITVGDFVHGAKEACSKESQSSPYLCLDATFIAVLLKEGYGFTDDRKLTIRMKINDVEISWALGATLDLFEKMT